MVVLDLKFDYENAGFCRTHYKTDYKGNARHIVILHNKNFDEICTASKDGEPDSPLKAGIYIKINDKKYITKKLNEYTILKEIGGVENGK